jgi:Fe-S-cluster containining protein
MIRPTWEMEADLANIARQVRELIAWDITDNESADAIGAAVLHIVDQAVERLRGEVACKRGCAWCCYHPVGVTIPEAVLLAEGMRRELSVAEVAGVRAQLAAHLEQTAGILDPQEYRRRRFPCPLLTDEGECGAYGLRPGVCRAYRSLDAQQCRASHADPETEVDTDVTAMWRMGAIFAGSFQAYMDAGRDCCIYDLSAALVAALDDITMGARWARGESFVAIRPALRVIP